MKKEAPPEKEIIKSVVIKRNMGKYDDIINLPHHESLNHPRMSNYNRAAQFAPFAALVGYEEALEKSTEKMTSRKEISDDKKQEIENTLNRIRKNTNETIEVTIEYFVVKDKSKSLGKYLTYTGKIKRIDDIERKIIFLNRKSIYIKDIYDIKETNHEQKSLD